MRNKMSTSVTEIIAFRGEERIKENNCFKLINKILKQVRNSLYLLYSNSKITTIMGMYN